MILPDLILLCFSIDVTYNMQSFLAADFMGAAAETQNTDHNLVAIFLVGASPEVDGEGLTS